MAAQPYWCCCSLRRSRPFFSLQHRLIDAKEKWLVPGYARLWLCVRQFSFIHSMLNNCLTCKPLLARAGVDNNEEHQPFYHNRPLDTAVGFATAATRPDSSCFAASPFHCASRKAFLDLLDSLSLPCRKRPSFFFQPMALRSTVRLFLSVPVPSVVLPVGRLPCTFRSYIFCAPYPSASFLSFLLRSLFLDELHCPFGFLGYYSQHSFWLLVSI